MPLALPYSMGPGVYFLKERVTDLEWDQAQEYKCRFEKVASNPAPRNWELPGANENLIFSLSLRRIGPIHQSIRSSFADRGVSLMRTQKDY